MSQSLPIKQLVANTSYLRLQQPLICITCIVPSYLFPQVKQTCLSYLPYILLLLFHHGACVMEMMEFCASTSSHRSLITSQFNPLCLWPLQPCSLASLPVDTQRNPEQPRFELCRTTYMFQQELLQCYCTIRGLLIQGCRAPLQRTMAREHQLRRGQRS